jgi:hypothetical protein
MYQHILSEAITFIETYHQHRFEINRVMQEAWEIEANEHRRTHLSPKQSEINDRSRKKILKIKHNIPRFIISRDGTQYKDIMTMCAIVVLAFSGVRIGELKSFSKASYEEKPTSSDGNSISILKGETSKGNAGMPIAEVWQTHHIAKDAIELIYDSTQNLRDTYTKEAEVRYQNNEIETDQYERYLREIKGAFLTLKSTRGKKPTFRTLLAGLTNLYGLSVLLLPKVMWMNLID